MARGFTLIETLIAVLLLSIAVAGPLTIAQKGLSSSVIAKDQVGAFFLAQDAVEYVRFKRDTNKLGGASWLTGLAVCSSAGGTNTCYIDSVQDTVAPCSGSCPVLNYDSSNRFFTYAGVGGTVTQTQQRYVRTIALVTPVGSNAAEAALAVTVSWQSAGGITRSVVVKENLFDW